MAKLIAFYSRAGENFFRGGCRSIEVGNTERAARMIAEVTGGDLFQIQQKNPYSDNYRVCVTQAKKDFDEKARPELVSMPDHLDEYDEIYLGYPNYCGTMPMAVYTFLEHFDWTGKIIHPFCTHEGSGIGKSEIHVAQSARGATVKPGLAVQGCMVDESREAIEKWCGE